MVGKPQNRFPTSRSKFFFQYIVYAYFHQQLITALLESVCVCVYVCVCVGGGGGRGGIKTYICSKDEEFRCDIMTGDASSVAVFVRE